MGVIFVIRTGKLFCDFKDILHTRTHNILIFEFQVQKKYIHMSNFYYDNHIFKISDKKFRRQLKNI